MAPRTHNLLSLLLLLAACRGEKTALPAADAGTDAAMASTDAAALAADAAPDVAPDLAADTASDVAPDLAADVGPDGAPDLAPDLATDAGPPMLGVVPVVHDYGDEVIGTMSDTFTFTVVNVGSGPADGLKVMVTGADFALPPANNKCAALTSLPALANCTVGVAFRPQSRGLKAGALMVSGGGQTVTVSLTGRGINDGGQLVISPMSQMLAGQVGIASGAVSMTVANIGDRSSGPLTTALGGTDASAFLVQNNKCGAPLASGAYCTLEVAVKAATAGAKMATLTVSSPLGGMAVANLSATVVAISNLTIAPNAADFMQTAVNATSAARTFEIKNTGGSATAPLAVSVGTAEFVITANTCGGTSLAVGATCSVSVAFRPTSTGAKSAVLTVSGSAGEIVQASLVGTGI